MWSKNLSAALTAVWLEPTLSFKSMALNKKHSPAPLTNLSSPSLLTRQTETERGQTHNQDDDLLKLFSLSFRSPLTLPFSDSLPLSHIEDLDVKEQRYWNSGQTSGNQSESEGCNYQSEMAMRESAPLRPHMRAHTSRHALRQTLAHASKPDCRLKKHTDCRLSDIDAHTNTSKEVDQHAGKSVCAEEKHSHTLKAIERWADWSSRSSASACLASKLKTAPLFITKYELSNRRPAEWLTYELSLFYQSDFQLLSSSFLWGSAIRQYRVEVLCSEMVQRFYHRLLCSWQHRCYPAHPAFNHKRCSLKVEHCVIMYMWLVQTKHFLLMQLHNKSI